MADRIDMTTDDKSDAAVDPNAPEPTATNEPVESTEPKETTERPEWLPEKFESPEDLAKAYGELSTKLGKAEPKEDSSAPEAAPGDVDFTKYSTEFANSGELAESSYEELAAQGYPKTMVDTYVQGLQATEAQKVQAVYTAAGGEENFKAISEWAGDNLSEAELKTFNTSLESSDPNVLNMATTALAAKYAAANGQPPQLIEGSPTASTNGYYQDVSEMVRDMQSPEYQSSEAFRAKVEAKLNNPMSRI